MNDILLFLHPTFGVLGICAAVWVFVEALNATESNQARMEFASKAVTVCICLAWILGGYWYVHFYGVDKKAILAGPWPFAHSLFMETKEHLFFIPLILAMYLPFVARVKLFRDTKARAMVMVVAALIIVNALAIEGAGAVINHGAKLAYFQRAQATVTAVQGGTNHE